MSKNKILNQNIMKSLKFFLFVLIGSLALTFIACEPDKPEPDKPEPEIKLEFLSLTADKELLYAGETATITAEAKGEEVTYQWSATMGSIIGSGETVTFAPTPCNTGESTITCKIIDKHKNALSKSLVITVE
ncbi:MAG: hypothetical protein GX793_01690 [Bacteroidales bacterium]|jgi:hypothetical protein|nr:hypothetical protein [Bacteroidales bacterium]MCK9498446.1 hypothetical protein [Bacteroidales bacterium]NLB85752.1 hypothetical protein [Bacteroidales bacterium]